MTPLIKEFDSCTNNRENVDAVIDLKYIPPPGNGQNAYKVLAGLAMPASIRAK